MTARVKSINIGEMSAPDRKLAFNLPGVMVAAALALGAATAFFNLGAHSLWFDEITGAKVATLKTVAEVVSAWVAACTTTLTKDDAWLAMHPKT